MLVQLFLKDVALQAIKLPRHRPRVVICVHLEEIVRLENCVLAITLDGVGFRDPQLDSTISCFAAGAKTILVSV